MRLLLWCLAPIALAGIAYATAQSLAEHDWLTAGPLLILLAVGIALIVPGDEAPRASAHSTPASATEDSALATASKAVTRV